MNNSGRYVIAEKAETAPDTVATPPIAPTTFIASGQSIYNLSPFYFVGSI
jgi:hypothetical protein